MANLFWKIKMAVKAMKVLKNGYLYYLIYFGLINKSQVIFITKNNIKLEIRLAKKSSDFHVFTEIWLDNAYLQNFGLKSNCTIIDIGSHVGMFSILCSQKFPNSKIFTFEPDKDNFKNQIKHMKMNKIKNVFSNNCAVSNITGEQEFFINDSDFAGHSLIKKSNKSVKIKSIKLEDILQENKIKKCDLIKIDCEGAEYDIVMDMTEKDLNKIENFCIEYENLNNVKYTIKDLVEKLQSNNFIVQLKKISENSGYLFAKKI